MAKSPLLHELLGMPKYLLDVHEPFDSSEFVSALETPSKNDPPRKYDDLVVDKAYSYCTNDRHITAAVIHLHPLLHNTPARDALLSIWHSAEDVSTLYELDLNRAEPKVYLLIGGSLRLVTENQKKKECAEIGQGRPGQWIGLPSALREFDSRYRKRMWSPAIETAVKAIPHGESVRAEWVYLDDLVQVMRKHEQLVRYIEQQVAIRYARREEMLNRFRENTTCRVLPPADLEYLMQLATIRRIPPGPTADEPSNPYLAAGKPSRRIALVVKGKCTAFIPGENNPQIRPDETERYAGKFGVSDLLGHEGLVMPQEFESNPENSSHSLDNTTEGPTNPNYIPDFLIEEPKRLTSIYALPGTEVLEFFWYAFRWTLDDRMAVWRRVVDQLLVQHQGARVPEIVAIQASRRKLGTTTLAEGLAFKLAESAGEPVCILDLKGEQRYKRYFEPKGFDAKTFTKSIEPTVRAQRSEDRTQCCVEFKRLLPPRDTRSEIYWPPDVHLIWPTNPDNALNLVEILQTESEFRYVIVCMRDDAERADNGARELAIRLNARCSTILYVTDVTERGYQFNEIEPPNLVWVERMTSEYMEREAKRMHQAMTEARLGGLVDVLPDKARDKATSALGGFPDTGANTDFVHRRQVVRVPNDSEGAQRANAYGPHALVGPHAPDGPFKRAIERLVRVITRQTVGLALGGGGAWGYSHVALIRNLEANKIPIDYITGASFGSIVGGLYAAAGRPALERLIAENSLSTTSSLAPVIATLTTPLMKTVIFAGVTAATIEWFVNLQLRRMGINGGKPIGLGTTEVPFYPISSNLTTHMERTEEHATIGHGVRLSGTMPPVAPAFRLRGDALVDGAFVANVPSRYLREIGADFVIAANAVPPAPTASSKRRGILQTTIDIVMSRMTDAMAANQLLTWKAGEDQSELHADYVCDLRPTDANVFDMWKGRAIVDQVHETHFSGSKATVIREAYDAFCAKPVAERTRRT